jgi:hypothetical protein
MEEADTPPEFDYCLIYSTGVKRAAAQRVAGWITERFGCHEHLMDGSTGHWNEPCTGMNDYDGLGMRGVSAST